MAGITKSNLKVDTARRAVEAACVRQGLPFGPKRNRMADVFNHLIEARHALRINAPDQVICYRVNELGAAMLRLAASPENEYMPIAFRECSMRILQQCERHHD